MTKKVSSNKTVNSIQTPKPVQLPAPSEPHPSEPTKTVYVDPNAPKPKKKVSWSKVLLILLVALLVAGGAVFGYFRYLKETPDSSVISDYSGGLSEDTPPQSEITPETETAKTFLQALQSKDETAVNNLSSDELKTQVMLEARDDNATVLSYYGDRFEGLDFNNFVSSVTDAHDSAGAAIKKVLLSDASSAENATGTYSVELGIQEQGGVLKVMSLKVNLSL